MIYLMTAFFLDFNHASTYWWTGFIVVGMMDIFIAFVKWDMNNE